MRRLQSHRGLLAVATAGLLAAGLAACSSSSSSSGSTSSSASSGTTTTGKTLVMESSPETAITQAFNPFATTQAAYGMGADGLIYEPLIQFNMVSPPQYYPWLATSYAWSNGGKTITFTIRQGVKWNNGTPLTPADVAFTFNMLKNNATVNLNGLKIQTVSTSGNTVTLTFPSAQYTNLQAIAGTAIVPQAVWSSAGNPATYQDSSPVGTGPYMLGTFTPQGIILKKNPYYWQAADVQVPAVDFPVYTSNTGALSALFAGQIDWTGNFIPGLQKNFVDTDPAHHGYWEAPGGTNSLFPNLNKWPTNQLPVRQAISLAINRSLIAQEGEAGLEQPVLNSTGMPLPTFQAWVGPVANMTNSATSNAAAAEQVLTKAGFTKGSNGFFEKNGQTVAVTIVDPTAYTDYAEVDSLVAQQLRAAGIDATFQGLSVERLERRRGRRRLPADLALVERRAHAVQHVRRLAGQLAGHRVGGDRRLRAAEQPDDQRRAGHAGCGRQRPVRADHRPGPDRAVHRGQPADHPDHHRVGVVRVQLAELHRLAYPAESVR